MKRLISFSLLALLGLAACDTERTESPLEPEIDGPSMAKHAFPDFEPPDECANCLVEPRIMVRGKRAPGRVVVEFEATPGQEAELVVYTSNPKTSTVKAWLNGKTVLRPSVIPQSGSDRVRVPLILEEHNILKVRLSAKPGNSVAFWVESGEVPNTRRPISTDIGVVPTGSSSAPVVVADNEGLAIMLLTDPQSGDPQGAAAALPGMDGFGLVRFSPSGTPLAAFFGGGVAYFDGWAVEGGTASVSVNIPPGGALPTAAISVALPSAFAPVVDWFLTSTPTSSPGAAFGTAQLQALSHGEALATQSAWCALEVAGALPPSANACRTSLIDGVPAFWAQWTEDIGFEPFLPTVNSSLNLAGCTGWDCLSLAETLAFATIADATPRKLTVASGDGQTGTIGTQLTDPLQVLITNEFDVALSGFLADFSVTAGEGMLAGSGTTTSIPTDAAGMAGTTWTLGPVVGAQGVGAGTISFLDLQAGFTATAEDVAPSVVFSLTSAAVGPTDDMNATCAELGTGFGIADWTDVAEAVAGGMQKADILGTGIAMILNNGVGAFTPMFQPTQHHMISAIGPGTPDLGSIGTDLFWLTSGTSVQRVLCMGPTT